MPMQVQVVRKVHNQIQIDKKKKHEIIIVTNIEISILHNPVLMKHGG